MEKIRDETRDDFRVVLYDTYKTDRLGKCRLAYKFYHDDRLIFEGDDFCPSLLHDIDSDESLSALLGFLCLKPGDVEEEYFAEYTTEQIDFAENHADDLFMWSDDLNNPENAL